MKEEKKVIAIDFDGTIADDSNFPIIGNMLPNAKEVITELSKTYKIVINSCRTSKMFNDHPKRNTMVKDMIKWLDDNKIPYDRINMGDEGKVVATLHIDNRALRFNGDWKQTLEDIKKCINL